MSKYYCGYTGLNKNTLKIKFTCFSHFNYRYRKLKDICEVRIMFLLNT